VIGGTYGEVLHVNLTTTETRIEQPSDDFSRLLVGGRAVVAYLLLRDLPLNTDPLSPDNPLIFAPGIMQGTNLPGSGRHGVGGKSPLTGAIAGMEITDEKFAWAKRRYYELMGWHSETAMPSEACLEQLQL
jgi:aldehyde:ferredoxin oxidoreductase